jgi:uncharacterized MnhB-related membrane protein
MNIKLKAALIATCIPTICAGMAYTIVQFPVLAVAAVAGGALYCMYRMVLSDLERREKYCQKKVK